MIRLSRWILRRLKWVAAVVLLLLLALRLLLGAGAFTGLIARGIGDRLSSRVKLRDSTVTFFRGSRVNELRVYEDGEDEPFLTARRAETDLDAYRFVRRRPLTRVDLYGVSVRL